MMCLIFLQEAEKNMMFNFNINHFSEIIKDNSTKLPTPGNYRTDYATNYIDHGLKPFVCPARVELDRLAALDAAQRSKYR